MGTKPSPGWHQSGVIAARLRVRRREAHQHVKLHDNIEIFRTSNTAELYFSCSIVRMTLSVAVMSCSWAKLFALFSSPSVSVGQSRSCGRAAHAVLGFGRAGSDSRQRGELPVPGQAARGHLRPAAVPPGCPGAPAALDGNVALQQPGMAAWGEPGGWVPLRTPGIPEHPCALLCIPPQLPRAPALLG